MNDFYCKRSKIGTAVISELRKKKVVVLIASCLLLLVIAFGFLFAVITVTSRNGEPQSEDNADAVDGSENESGSTQSAPPSKRTLPTYVVSNTPNIQYTPNIVAVDKNAPNVTEGHLENVGSEIVKSHKSAVKSEENTEENVTENSKNAKSYTESAPKSIDYVENAFNISKSATSKVITNAEEFKYFEKAGDIEKMTIQDGTKSGYFSTCTIITMLEGTTVERNRRSDIRLRGKDREIVELNVDDDQEIILRFPTKNNQWNVLKIHLWSDLAIYWNYEGRNAKEKWIDISYPQHFTLNDILKHFPNGTIFYEKVSLYINATTDFITLTNVAANITVEMRYLSKKVPLILRRNAPTNKTTVIEVSTDAIVYERKNSGHMYMVIHDKMEEKIQISLNDFYVDLENELGHLHFAPNTRVTVADRMGKQIKASLIDRNLLHVEYVNGTAEMSVDDKFGQISANFTNESLLANAVNQSFSLKNGAGEMCLREGKYVDVKADEDSPVYVNLEQKIVRVVQGEKVQLYVNGWRGPNGTEIEMGYGIKQVKSRIANFEDYVDYAHRRRVLNITHANGYTSLYPTFIDARFNGIPFYNHILDGIACCDNNVSVSKNNLRMIGEVGGAQIGDGKATVESNYVKITVEPFYFQRKILKN